MIIKISRLRVWSFALVFAAVALGTAQYNELEKSQVVKKIPTERKVVALTIDDGPNAKTTPELLQVLRAKHVKATFFILASNAERHPEILAQTVADGHEIGTHAYSHRLLTKMSAAEYERELDLADQIISKNAPKPSLFRPPGGAYDDGILVAAHKRGYTTIMWSIDTRDWSRPGVEAVVSAVMNNVKPGSIVLMHDGQYPLPTPEAVAIIIDKLREQGYELVTVGELLQYNKTVKMRKSKTKKEARRASL